MKLQNCYGNVSYISVPRWRPSLKMLRIKEVTALKKAAENLNTRKSTVNWVRVFENWCDENGLEKNPETVRSEQLDKVLERFFACVIQFVTRDIKRQSNGILVKLGNNFTCVLSKFY